ncbi:glutaredoxin, putative [Perkinsus marinus ATCC 50983]|uniref:Glutaredoxin, putative n=1 Tax=Perkinsus marinus (strain ATCC 50983 / TXsc) TaxID=423536 RepID=C5K8R9_PERM5|nr:glutaredoxin, putative [Perkinsus marinus ATCC 50983]EER19146.1 glutaredoxin, putative [Perkinsus marinus ATCC 50983]|eukprot:XP_002787350.1 glutaredoxin, putative [Perkinsus marinus ATCC 50983]
MSVVPLLYSLDTIEFICDVPVIAYIDGNLGLLFMMPIRIASECVESFAHMNILANDMLREGVKKYSDWPTYPQLYVDGEFVGGCDIVLQMAEDGELHDLLLEKGVISA